MAKLRTPVDASDPAIDQPGGDLIASALQSGNPQDLMNLFQANPQGYLDYNWSQLAQQLGLPTGGRSQSMFENNYGY